MMISQFTQSSFDDKALRLALKEKGIDARRFSRFTQLALLGALPLKAQIQSNTGIYLASSFSSPSKFNRIFEQLTQQNLPSPLDFMANLNNAVTFQLAQTLETTGNSLFIAVDEQDLWQPLELALLDLDGNDSTSLVGWALESPYEQGFEGSIWALIDNTTDVTELRSNLSTTLHKLFHIV